MSWWLRPLVSWLKSAGSAALAAAIAASLSGNRYVCAKVNARL